MKTALIGGVAGGLVFLAVVYWTFEAWSQWLIDVLKRNFPGIVAFDKKMRTLA